MSLPRTTLSWGERTRDASDGPWVIGFKDSLQDQTHDGELHDAAKCRGDERATDAEVEGAGDNGIEEDKGEAEANVGPGQVGRVSGCRVHGKAGNNVRLLFGWEWGKK